MTSVALPLKDFSLHSSDVMSLESVTSLERQAVQYQVDVDRFASPTLNRQRVVVSDKKEMEQATLAVCAKIERAISRRLSQQDAVFTKKPKANLSRQGETIQK